MLGRGHAQDCHATTERQVCVVMICQHYARARCADLEFFHYTLAADMNNLTMLYRFGEPDLLKNPKLMMPQIRLNKAKEVPVC